MMDQKPYIISIVGPESSGKTTLARQLAAEYGCAWVSEYAREYLEERGGDYDESDLVMIAEGQLAAISEQLAVCCEQLSVSHPGPLMLRPANAHPYATAQQPGVNYFASLMENLETKDVLTFQSEDFGDEPRPILIIDSGMMGMRMWAKIKYNMTIPVVEKAMEEDMTSMYILCRPVWPWESDPLREAPLLLDRAWIYNHFLQELFLTQSK